MAAVFPIPTYKFQDFNQINYYVSVNGQWPDNVEVKTKINDYLYMGQFTKEAVQTSIYKHGAPADCPMKINGEGETGAKLVEKGVIGCAHNTKGPLTIRRDARIGHIMKLILNEAREWSSGFHAVHQVTGHFYTDRDQYSLSWDSENRKQESRKMALEMADVSCFVGKLDTSSRDRLKEAINSVDVTRDEIGSVSALCEWWSEMATIPNRAQAADMLDKMQRGDVSDADALGAFTIRRPSSARYNQFDKAYKIMGILFVICGNGERGFIFDRPHIQEMRQVVNRISCTRDYIATYRVSGTDKNAAGRYAEAVRATEVEMGEALIENAPCSNSKTAGAMKHARAMFFNTAGRADDW